jgi:sulfate permease, SulP family
MLCKTKSPLTLATAVAVLTMILGSRRISKKIPGALLAVIGAILASWALDLGSHGVATLGAVPSGLPRFGLPQWGRPDDQTMTISFRLGTS